MDSGNLDNRDNLNKIKKKGGGLDNLNMGDKFLLI